MTNPAFAGIVKDYFALSAWDGSRCVAAAGIVPIYGYRAAAWAMISKDIGSKNMLQLTRKVRAALELDPTPRIETVVRCDFEDGHRWAALLGMELECAFMRKHGIDGQDEAMYVRIK